MHARFSIAMAAIIVASCAPHHAQATAICNNAAIPYNAGVIMEHGTFVMFAGNGELGQFVQFFNHNSFSSTTEPGRLLLDGLLMTILDGNQFVTWDHSGIHAWCAYADELQLVDR